MDTSPAQLCFLGALLSILLATGNAIKCYSCSSATEMRCADPMSSDMESIECVPDIVSGTISQVARTATFAGGLFSNDQGYGQGMQFDCFKWDATIGLLGGRANLNKTTIRGCIYARTDRSDPCADIKKRLVDANAAQFCELCSTDNCNGANGVHAVSTLTVLLSTLLCFILLRK